MPVYEYKGLNAQGKVVKGVREADSPRALKALLKKEGIFLTELYEEKVGRGSKQVGGQQKSGSLLSKEVDFKKYFQRVKAQEIAFFTRQLATLLRAGIPLIEALSALAEQTTNEKFKRVLSQIKDQVNEGSSLADALKNHSKIFSSLYINMVRAGESSGTLEIVLQRLADHTEAQLALRRKIVGTLTYPAVMLVFSILIIFVLMTVVVPKMTQLFEDINATLPTATKILIGISDFASSYWFVYIPLLALGIFFLRRYIRSEEGKKKFDQFLLKLPIFGELFKMIATSRFTSTLATLLSSGVPMLTALEIAKSVIGNYVFEQVIEKARDDVREGESLAKPIKESGLFDPLVSHMISVGEKSGELESMLQHVSKAYEEQIEAKINQLTSLLEPLILIFMAAVVGFVVVSIMLPIMQLNSAIQG